MAYFQVLCQFQGGYIFGVFLFFFANGLYEVDGLDRYLQSSLTLMFQSHTSVAIFIGIHRVHTVIILCMSAIYSNTCCMQFTK